MKFSFTYGFQRESGTNWMNNLVFAHFVLCILINNSAIDVLEVTCGYNSDLY